MSMPGHAEMVRLLSQWAPTHAAPAQKTDQPPGLRAASSQDSCMVCAYMLLNRGAFAAKGTCSRFRTQVSPTSICDEFEG